MTLTADASFLVSLYGVNVNTPAARAWMQAAATPLRVEIDCGNRHSPIH